MADLGTLWFGADIDLTRLKQQIQQGNQSILDALKMNYDPRSYQDMVNSLRTALNNETFQIKISTDAQTVAQNLRQQFSGITGTSGQSVNLAGLTGINGMTRDILNQREAVRDTRAEVEALREAWQRASARYGKDSQQAQAAHHAYQQGLRDLRESRYELSGLNIERGKAQLAQKVLTEQTKQASAAAKQLSSDSVRLNTTLAGGIHISTQLGSALSSVFAVDAARQFLNSVIEIGGQLEKQRISMGAIIGDTARANELFEQIKDLAIKSPFGVVELDQYSKQLAAYGIEQSKLFDMTKRLADISAGAGQDIGRLALALGHVKSATYLTGITLRQFSMNNIPMLKMLADYYTEVEKRAVTTAEVQKRISNRQVSYEDVEEQIRRMTDEGGQFFNMQEKISESLSAKFKNLKDSFDIMYGEIAESSLGDFLKGIASILTSMSRHWEEFAALLGGAAAVLGVFKIALLPVNRAMMQFGQETVLTSTRLNAQRIAMGLNTAETRALSAATIDVMVKQGLLSRQQLLTAVATKKLTVAQAELAAANFNVTKGELFQIASMGRWGLAMRTLTVGVRSLGVALKGLMFNPFTIALTAITAAVELFMHFKNKTDETKQSVKDLVNIANEGFENILDVLKKFPEKTLDGATMSGGIKEITEALKNYAPNANAILEEANAINDLAARYAFLRGELESTKNAYADLEKTADYVVNANNATGNIINDTFTEQVDDYLDDLRDVRKAEQEFLYHRIAINEALDKIAKSVPEFAKGRYDEEGNLKGLKEQIELLKSINIANVGQAYQQFTQSLAASNSAASKALNEWSVALSDADKRMRDEVMPDLIKFAQKLDDSYKGTSGWGENWKQNGDHVKTAILAVTKELEKIPDMTDAVKNDLLDKIFNEQWHLNIKFTTEEAEEQLTGWQKEMQDYFDENHIYIRLSMSSTREDVIKQIEVERKKAQEIADNAGKVLIGIGFQLDKLPTNLPGPLATPWNQDALQGYQQQTDYINKLNAAIDRYNLNVSNRAADKARKAAETAANKAEREAEKRAKERTKQEEARLKIEEELAKQRLELQDAIADAEVAAIENNAERERRQRKVEFEKQKRQLDRQVEEWKKKSFELAKKEYEANPKNKTVSFYDTPVGQAGWQAQSLSTNQEQIIEEREKEILANEKRYIKERRDAQILALQEYVKAYGSAEQQRQAVTEEYEKKIREAREAGNVTEAASLAKKLEEEIGKIDFKKIQDDLNWEQVFSDLDRYTTEALRALRENLVKALDAKDITAENAKVIVDKINEIDDKVTQRTDAWASFLPILRERKRLTQEVANAELVAEKAKKKQVEEQAALVAKQLEAQRTLRSLGLNRDDVSAKGLAGFLKSLDPASEAFKKLSPIVKDLTTHETNLAQATEEAAKEIAKKNAIDTQLKNFNSLSEAYKKGVDAAGGEIQWGLQQATELNELIDAIGLHDTEFAKGVKEFTDGANHFASAIQKWQTGDFVGALTDAILGVQDYGHLIERIGGFSFNGSNAQEVINTINALNGRNDALINSIDRLNDTMSGKTGNKAIEAYARIAELQKELEDNLTKIVNEQMAYHSAHHSFNDYFSGFTDEELERFNRLNDTSWNGSLQNLTADLAAMIKADADMWQKILSTGEGGYGGRVAEKISDLAEQAGIAKQQIDALNSALTNGLTADTVYSDFLDSLYDMADGAEDVMENIEENWQKMVNRMVVDNLVGAKLQQDLKGWYEALADLQKRRQGYDANGNPIDAISDEQYRRVLNNLKNEYNYYLYQAKKDIEFFTEAGIIKPITEAEEEASHSFENLSDSWKSALKSMTRSSKDFKDSMKEEVFSRLVDNLIEKYSFDDTLDYIGEKLDEAIKKGDYEQIEVLLNSLAENLDGFGEHVDKIKEKLGINTDEELPFDNIKSEFVNTLLDMETSAEDFGKNIATTLLKEMLDTLLDKEFADDLKQIREMWQQILNGDETVTWQDVMNAVTELNKKMAENENVQNITNAVNSLKEVADDDTFSKMGDSFVSTLMNMSSTAEDFAEQIGKTMVEKIMKEMVVATMLQPLLNDLQKAFNTETAKDGATWVSVMGEAAIQDAIGAIVAKFPELQEAAKQLMEAFNVKSDENLPLSDLGSTIIDALTNTEEDVEKAAEDFGKNVALKLMNEMLTELLDQRYAERIKEIREHWQKALAGEEGYTWQFVRDEITGLANDIQNLDDTDPITNLTTGIKELTKETEQADETFKSMSDSLTSTLMDMSKTADDVSKDIGRTMAENIIKEMVTPSMLQPLLNNLQNVFDGVMKKAVTKDEKGNVVYNWGAIFGSNELQEAIQSITDQFPEAQEAVKRIMELFGLNTSNYKYSGFSNLGDGILDSLKSAEGSLKSWSEDMGKTMAEDMAKAYIDATWGDEIDKLNERWQKAQEIKDPGAREAELKAIREELEALYKVMENDATLKNLTDQFKELVDTPLDNMRSTFLSDLMDMERGINDFANDVNKILTEAFIDEFVLGDAFDAQLEEWKERYREISNAGYSEEQRAAEMRKLQDAIVAYENGAKKQAQEIFDLMAYGTYKDQDATMNMADKITYDQADQLLGINLAQEITLEQILATLKESGIFKGSPAILNPASGINNDEQSKLINATLMNMAQLTQQNHEGLMSQVGIANNHLQVIHEYSVKMYNVLDQRLSRIESNTTNLRRL